MRLFYLIPVLLMLSSCSRELLYFPDRANTPGLTERLEGKLTLSGKGQTTNADTPKNGKQYSYAVDAAFAPINHLGIIASWRGLRDRSGTYKDSAGSLEKAALYNGSRWEGGAGYFGTFGQKGRYEIYGGFGAGTIYREGVSDPFSNYSIHYNRYFIQPAVGAGNHIYSVMGGLRFVIQQYRRFFSASRPQLRYEIADTDPPEDIEGSTLGLLEPFINSEIGWKYARFNLQVGSSIRTSGPRVMARFPAFISAGLVLQFAPSFLTRKR